MEWRWIIETKNTRQKYETLSFFIGLAATNTTEQNTNAKQWKYVNFSNHQQTASKLIIVFLLLLWGKKLVAPLWNCCLQRVQGKLMSIVEMEWNTFSTFHKTQCTVPHHSPITSTDQFDVLFSSQISRAEVLLISQQYSILVDNFPFISCSRWKIISFPYFNTETTMVVFLLDFNFKCFVVFPTGAVYYNHLSFYNFHCSERRRNQMRSNTSVS